MKRKIFTFLIFLITIQTKGAELRTIQIENSTVNYYFSSSTKESKGLMIFMHGAVSQFTSGIESKSVPLETLVENNKEFLPYCNSGEYDVILPIATKEFNWLELKGKVLIDTLIKIHKENNMKVYLSGFSDGGTGAYKYFYTTPEQYDGVIIFNGYPQHGNFYKTVNYQKVTNKKVMFFSQANDKVIPYEFLLTKYRRQKMVNRETYFLLKEGRHKFNEYAKNDFIQFISILDSNTLKADKGNMLIYAPIDGLMVADKIITLYNFRAGKVKKYGLKKTEYLRRDYDYKTFSKMLKEAPILFHPAAIIEEDLLKNDMIEFTYEYQGMSYKIMLNNYLNMKVF